MSKPAITAKDLLARLEAKHSTDKGWIVLPEVRDAMGFGRNRSADAVAVNTWQSVNKIVTFEIKVSVQDFRRELEDPSKRGVFVDQVHEFWFVAPKGVIPHGEVPEGCGLLETYGKGLRATVRAKQDMDRNPSFEFWMSLVRACHRQIQRNHDRVRAHDFAEFAGKPVGIEDLRRLAEKLALRKYDYDVDSLRKWRDSGQSEAREARSEWWKRWKRVLNESQRLAKKVDSDCGWAAEPEQVEAALKSIGVGLDAETMAKQLREAADLIESSIGGAA